MMNISASVINDLKILKISTMSRKPIINWKTPKLILITVDLIRININMLSITAIIIISNIENMFILNVIIELLKFIVSSFSREDINSGNNIIYL
jgi:hypothetical protein